MKLGDNLFLKSVNPFSKPLVLRKHPGQSANAKHHIISCHIKLLSKTPVRTYMLFSTTYEMHCRVIIYLLYTVWGVQEGWTWICLHQTHITNTATPFSSLHTFVFNTALQISSLYMSFGFTVLRVKTQTTHLIPFLGGIKTVFITAQLHSFQSVVEQWSRCCLWLSS